MRTIGCEGMIGYDGVMGCEETISREGMIGHEGIIGCERMMT